MLKVGIMGANGYAGEELLRILVKHPEVKITVLAGKTEKVYINKMYPWLEGILELECSDLSAEEVADRCDCVFLALPHKVSMQFVPVFLKKKKKVIDLSADFRLKDKVVYEKWYEKHVCPEYIKNAVYGLPEFYRDKIKKAELIANPGCYPTSIILGCAPLLKKGIADTKFIIADSKSGVSGAGRVIEQAFRSGEMQNSFKPYKVNSHRHMPEIDQELTAISGKDAVVNFIPHLVPMERGMESTIYLRLKKKIDTDAALKLYKDFYKDEYFVRVMNRGVYPDTKNIVKQNFCDVGIEVFPEKEMAIAMTVIDNLTKGASGQAVQNMNIMYGFEEKTGL